MKGRDGDQGPYQLVGKDGNKEIVILAGTEKVWCNGKEMIRGANYDYIIDYSTAEVIFTPKVMIDFDSDLSFMFLLLGEGVPSLGSAPSTVPLSFSF